MSEEVTAGGATRRRGVYAVLVGVAAGLAGMTVSRIVLGPSTARFASAIGAAALITGTLLSWRLHNRRRPADSHGIPRVLRLRRQVHPTAWVGPVAGSIITLAAWAGVAHSSGSGWVQAVGSLLAAFLLVGLMAPAWPARRARISCTASPFDGQAGLPLVLTVEADRPVRIRPVFPRGPDHQAGGRQRGGRSVRLEVTPLRRGVLDAVVVELGSSAPFGLLWWCREVELALPHDLHIAPRTGDRTGLSVTAHATVGDAAPRVPSGIGEPRGIRPYAPGDPRRAVHWPATSHAGTLMVRESERPTDDPVFVEMVLPRQPDEAEAEAERTMSGVAGCLARHQSVVLATSEPAGRVVRPVTDRLDLGRRLARAVPT